MKTIRKTRKNFAKAVFVFIASSFPALSQNPAAIISHHKEIKMSIAVIDVKEQTFKEQELFPCQNQGCSRKLLLMDENGHHNFAPMMQNGNIINVCMECKMKEVAAIWNK